MGKGDSIVVEHVVTKSTVEEDAQIEILVTEGVGPAKGEVRERIADDGTVLFIDLAVLVDILVLDIADPHGIAAGVFTVGRILVSAGAVLDVI